MSLPDFDFVLPDRIEEALRLLADAGPRGHAMAGGTDVMVLMKQGALAPQVIVGLGGIAELRGIRRENGSVAVGSGTTLAAILSDSLLARHAPGLVDAAARMATEQIRTVATAGGNLATAAACGDLAPILIALDAWLRLRTASGERDLPLEDFFTGVRATILERGELITSIEVPAREAGSGSAYVKFGYRRGAQVAVVSAAACVTRNGDRVRSVRLVLGAVAPAPVLVLGASALLDQPMEGSQLAAACDAAAVECSPISDLRGSEAYRRAMVPVVARRALELAWKRSQS